MNSAKFCGLLCLTLLTTPARDATGASTPRPKSLPALHSRAQFDALARVTDTPYPLPHLLFVIDRRDHDRMYYADSKRYKFHRDFVNGAYLSLDTGQKFFADNYLNPNRRFVMGTLAYQTPVKRFAFEFWEGDPIPAPLLKLTAARIGATFFAPVAFKPNSLQQEEVSASVPGLARLLPDAIVKPTDYQPLNKARAVGRLRIVAHWDENADIRPGDIVVINDAPVDLPPVAGLITAQPASPLSHINLRARSWGIPNAYIARAPQVLASYEGQTVVFETRSDQYLIGRPSAPELAQQAQRDARRHALMTPQLDLSVTAIAGLSQQRASSVTAYGAKSANLGEVQHAHLPGVQVPDGFTLPFFRYAQFLRQNGLEAEITALLHDPDFRRAPDVRRKRLADLRARFQSGHITEDLKADVLERAHAQFAGQGLFVRSSTNSEDLPNFNGAGLYTTVPNARTDEQILEAIKTVWASVWNAEAYEARERAGIDHQKVAMAVLLQRGVNADSAGVLITADPFDPQNKDAIYVSAKRGLGIKVVEGKKIPEQVIFHPETNAVQVLTRSAEDSLLTFDARGGVREVAFTDKRAVLTDDVVHRLAHAAAQIRRLFGSKPQDIEWAAQGGQVFIVQARPYLTGE